jgi:N-hydroxyarylamine O-acetyltransferase
MDVEKYLKRINFTDSLVINEQTLSNLHELHTFNVPFENLDIHYKRPFDLQLENVYEKVVMNFRGGFCYELNNIFNELLHHIGFNSKIISAQIIDASGTLGPEYDHMAVCIECHGKKYLADVGYGDLFTRPIEICKGIQNDGRHQFLLRELTDQEFILSMYLDDSTLVDKYRFNIRDVSVEKFNDICLEKQTSPSSYFVKNVVCTKPTISGRVTIFNDRLVEKKGMQRIERLIVDDSDLRVHLRDLFGITLAVSTPPVSTTESR